MESTLLILPWKRCRPTEKGVSQVTRLVSGRCGLAPTPPVFILLCTLPPMVIRLSCALLAPQSDPLPLA